MLALMDPDDAVELIEELGNEKAEKLLRLMGVKEEKAIRNLLGYEEDTAGRIMTSDFVALPSTATVQDAIDAIRKLDDDFESVYYVYTTDPSGMLTGVLSLRTLIAGRARRPALRPGRTATSSGIAPDLDQEQVTEEMTKYDLVAIPVCDENRHMLGIVTFDDAMDVIAEEHQEDLQIAGLSSGESTTGESAHSFAWFAQRQYWIVVWAIAACAIAAIAVSAPEGIAPTADVTGIITGRAFYALMPILIMPVVLLAAMRMTAFVKNSFLEYDEREDEPLRIRASS